MQGRYLLWSHKVPWHFFFPPTSVNVQTLWTMTSSLNKQRGLCCGLLSSRFPAGREHTSSLPNTTWRCLFTACAEPRLQALISSLNAPWQFRAWEDLPAVSSQRAVISAASKFIIDCLFVCLLTHVRADKCIHSALLIPRVNSDVLPCFPPLI